MNYPQINPTLFNIGPLEIRWYGLMYFFSLIIGYLLLKRFLKFRAVELKKELYESLIFYIMLGVVIGGRLGYVIFYHPLYYLQNPLHIFTVWQGGMSFHGGALGVIILGFWFCRKYNLRFYQLADPAMPLISIGLLLGRLGNFINGELYGRITTLPWGMIFPESDGRPRHPSQLYEAFLEGILLFLISYLILRFSRREGIVFWSWIGLYGLFRFLVEFLREPDAHLGFIISFLTMGQILSLAMIIAGMIGLYRLHLKTDQNGDENT
ncbi:MAG: prolipoprotein diacylglyceryl transferase [Candidatus Cloacimonetes bacterium]|nr:prolipoprotein diacylglyceryl transferase [Candidatus Cloacimonadota bacterium]